MLMLRSDVGRKNVSVLTAYDGTFSVTIKTNKKINEIKKRSDRTSAYVRLFGALRSYEGVED